MFYSRLFFVREVMLGFWFYRPVDQNTNTVDRSVAVVPVPPSSNLSHPSFLFLILSFIMPLQQTLFDKACTNMWTTYLRMPSNVRGCFSTGDHFCSACAGTTRPSSSIRGCFIVFFLRRISDLLSLHLLLFWHFQPVSGVIFWFCTYNKDRYCCMNPFLKETAGIRLSTKQRRWTNEINRCITVLSRTDGTEKKPLS